MVSNGPYGAPIFPLNFNRLPSFFIDFRRTTKMTSETTFLGIWGPSFPIVLRRTSSNYYWIEIETITKYFFLFFIDTHLLKFFFTAYSLKFNDTHLLKFFSTAYSLKFNDTHLLKFFFTAYSLKFNDSLKTDFRPVFSLS